MLNERFALCMCELGEKRSCQRNVLALRVVFRGSAKTVSRGQSPFQQMTDCFSNTCTITSINARPCLARLLCMFGRKEMGQSWQQFQSSVHRWGTTAQHHLPPTCLTAYVFDQLFFPCFHCVHVCIDGNCSIAVACIYWYKGYFTKVYMALHETLLISRQRLKTYYAVGLWCLLLIALSSSLLKWWIMMLGRPSVWSYWGVLTSDFTTE